MLQIGVLRLIDEDMIDAVIKLETHPFGGTRRPQQPLGGGNHVVIINHPQPRLGGLPIRRQPLADAQMPRRMGNGRIQPLFGQNRQQRRAKLGEQRPQRRVGTVRRCRHRRWQAHLILGGQEKPAQMIERRHPVIGAQPRLRPGRCIQCFFAAIGCKRRHQPGDARRIEPHQCRVQRCFGIAVRWQAKAAPQHRHDPRHRQASEHIAVFRQPPRHLGQPHLALIDADRCEIIEKLAVAIKGRRFDGFGEQPALQGGAAAIIERRKPRRHPGFNREAGDQPLGERMDGLHRQPLRRIEQLREQPPGAGLGQRIDARPQGAQIAVEHGIAAPRPERQPVCHPRLHLGRCQLGKGDAQQRFGRRAAQQQAQHTG